MRNLLSDLFSEKGWCVSDGVTGTYLFDRGLEFDEMTMIDAFGDAWANVNIDNVGGDDRRKRRGCRRLS